MNKLLIFVLLFSLWAYRYGKACPCNTKGEYECVRDEVWGVQPNHFFLFMLCGIIFPNRFWELMFLGLLWEIWEYYISQYPEFVYKFGGCLTKRPQDPKSSPIIGSRVYAGERKYHNPIDEILGLEHPRWHTWHGSAAELIPNVLGFLTGYIIVSNIPNERK